MAISCLEHAERKERSVRALQTRSRFRRDGSRFSSMFFALKAIWLLILNLSSAKELSQQKATPVRKFFYSSQNYRWLLLQAVGSTLTGGAPLHRASPIAGFATSSHSFTSSDTCLIRHWDDCCSPTHHPWLRPHGSLYISICLYCDISRRFMAIVTLIICENWLLCSSFKDLRLWGRI